MNRFKIGDLVETLDDHIFGKVVAIDRTLISVADNDGFVFEFEQSSLMLKTPSELISEIDYDEVEEAKHQKSVFEKKKQSRSHLRNTERSFTVDLHIEKLVDSIKGMSNYDMLNLQLDTAKRQLEFAISKRMLKIVFIHGVGEGVLKMELYTLLRRYDNLQFYDADFRSYGLGATEVKIYQSK